MADITRLSRFLNGVERGIDLQTNTPVVLSIKIGGVSNTELTKTILDKLVTLQDGSDFASGTNSHTHDGRYRTETELSSTSNGQGASFIGIEDAATQFTSTNVEGALTEALDAAQAAQSDITTHLNGGASKHDATEVDYERGDGSKKDIQAASDDVETALTDLDDNKISKAGLVTYTANQPMGGFKLTGLAAGSANGDSLRYNELGAANGIATLNGSGKVPVAQLPNAIMEYQGVFYSNGALGTGSLTAIAAAIGSGIEDGDTFTLEDQSNTVTFEFDVAGGGVGGGNVAVALASATETAATVKAAMIAAINGSILLISATSGTGNLINLSQLEGGTAGNTTILESISNAATLTPVNFTGGTGTPTPALANGGGNADSDIGNVYRVYEENAVDFGAGAIQLYIGDYVILNSDKIWERSDSTDAVASVNSMTGDVTINAINQLTGDVTTSAASGSESKAATIAANAVDAGKLASNAVTTIKINADAVTGTKIRLDNNQYMRGRNAADSADINMWKVNTSNEIEAGVKVNADVAYTPSVLADWDGSADPGDVNEGLDQLAERVTDLESADSSSSLTETLVLGEALGITGVRAFRYMRAADGGFVAGRLQRADNDATSVDNFHVMGLYVSLGTESAGDSFLLVKQGAITATAHGFTIGEPIFLGTTGALTNTAPTAASSAVVIVGYARTSSIIDVKTQVMGVN